MEGVEISQSVGVIYANTVLFQPIRAHAWRVQNEWGGWGLGGSE